MQPICIYMHCRSEFSNLGNKFLIEADVLIVKGTDSINIIGCGRNSNLFEVQP